jgi:hypothetical protein
MALASAKARSPRPGQPARGEAHHQAIAADDAAWARHLVESVLV